MLTYKSTYSIIMLMQRSPIVLDNLLSRMTQLARTRGLNDARWAAAAGLPRETLSRLRRRTSCDLGTLVTLAEAIGARLTVMAGAATETTPDGHFPRHVDRDYESRLLALAASADYEPANWRALGPAFFMGGLAAMLASSRGADRNALMTLADSLHPGMSHPHVFNVWLERSPVKPSRFLPMFQAELRHAA